MKMFSKKILAVGLLGALGAGSAHAFNLDLSTQTGSTYALESLDSAGGQVVGLVTYPKVSNTSNVLDVVNTYGLNSINGSSTYIRYDLTNAVFGAVPTLTITQTTNTISTGGAAGNGFVIFRSVAGAAIPSSNTSTMTAASYASLDVTKPSTISYTVYETLTLASSQGASLVAKTAKSGANIWQYSSGLTTTITPQTTGVASVDLGFAKFKATALPSASNLTAHLGTASVAAAASILSADDGAAVALADMILVSTSTGTVTGGGAFGIATQSLGLSASNACGSQTAIASNAAKTAGTAFTIATLNGKTFLCYNVTALNGTTQIPVASYTLTTVNKPAAATRTNQTTTVSKVFGSVSHDGTTVQLPYLTTFADYNQRLVLVNRGTGAATYSISSFQTEAGTTAVAGTKATGTIPAGSSVVAKVTDIVTLTGGTRAAATLSVVAPSSNVSVATTQVNKSSGATDTVSLQ